MVKTIKPSQIKGEVTFAASKSFIQRAIFAAALAHGESELIHLSNCEDASVALNAIQVLGAKVTREKTIKIIGNLKVITVISINRAVK